MLCEEGVVFMFHSRSKDAPPGMGVGESLGSLPASAFSSLASTKNWRQVLSNFAPAAFDLDGLRWPSVEHFFQAAKFKHLDRAYWASFAEGGVVGGKDGAAAKSAGGRRGRPLNDAQRAAWETTKQAEMKKALTAKYRQNAAAQKTLLATWPAQLTHRPLRARHTQVETGLMEVRAALRVVDGGAVSA